MTFTEATQICAQNGWIWQRINLLSFEPYINVSKTHLTLNGKFEPDQLMAIAVYTKTLRDSESEGESE